MKTGGLWNLDDLCCFDSPQKRCIPCNGSSSVSVPSQVYSCPSTCEGWQWFFLTPVAMVLAFLSTRHKKGPHWHLFFTVWPHRTSSWYWERGPGLQLSSPRTCRDTEEATLLSIQVQKTTHPLFHLYLMKIFIPYIMSGAIDQNCNLPTVQLWASYLISLCLSDHKCKTGSIRELAS